MRSLTEDRPLRHAVLLGAVLLLAVAVARQGEVIAEGDLLPAFASYEVTLVRVLGAELYVDRSADAGDSLTAAALVLAAALLLLAAPRVPGRPRRAFTRGAFGALFLAADDLLSAHETIGHNLPALAGIPLVDHPDDVVVAGYAAGAVVFLWRERELIRGVPATPWLVAATAAGLAVAHDITPLHFRLFEESLEILAAGAGLVGVAALSRHHVDRARQSAVTAKSSAVARSRRSRV